MNRNGEVEGQQELVDLVDVKLGQEYELVVTTYSRKQYFELISTEMVRNN